MAQSPDSPGARMKRIWRAMLRELIPEVAAGRHVPFRAKVLSVQAVAAGRSDELTPRYVATVRPLMPDGSEDKRKPALADVAIQTLWVGANGEGLFRLPPPGAVVRVVYDYGDPSLPVIAGVLTDGQTVPDAPVGELVMQNGPEVWIKLKADGTVELQQSNSAWIRIEPDGSVTLHQGAATWARLGADGKIVLEAANILVGDGATEPLPLGQALLDWLNQHTHLGNLGAQTSPPVVPGQALTLLSAKHKVK